MSLPLTMLLAIESYILTFLCYGKVHARCAYVSNMLVLSNVTFLLCI